MLRTSYPGHFLSTVKVQRKWHCITLHGISWSHHTRNFKALLHEVIFSCSLQSYASCCVTYNKIILQTRSVYRKRFLLWLITTWNAVASQVARKIANFCDLCFFAFVDVNNTWEKINARLRLHCFLFASYLQNKLYSSWINWAFKWPNQITAKTTRFQGHFDRPSTVDIQNIQVCEVAMSSHFLLPVV